MARPPPQNSPAFPTGPETPPRRGFSFSAPQMPRKPGPPPEVLAERKRRASGKVTAKAIAHELRIGVMCALDMNGGVKYIDWLAKHKPALYVDLLKCAMRGAPVVDETDGVRFVVQQLTINAAPVAGVINSPIAGHIAGPNVDESRGEVIDVEMVAHDE